MAVRFQMIMRGTKETASFFKSFSKGQTKMIDKSAEDIAWRFANLAKKKAPYASGDLMESIKFRKMKTGLWRVYIGTPVYNEPRGRTYPFMQERGFARHRIHTSMINEKIRAKFQIDGQDRVITVGKSTPFMYPALMQMRGEPKKIITKRIKQLVDKAARQSHAYMK